MDKNGLEVTLALGKGAPERGEGRAAYLNSKHY